MTNQLLNVENCVGVEPKKVVGQGFELRVVNYCHSLLQTELMIPTWYIFLQMSSNSNQILSKVSSCPFVVPDTSSPKESSVLRVDLVCLRTCWTLVLTWSLKWFALVDREFSSSIGTEQQPPRHQPDTLDSTCSLLASCQHRRRERGEYRRAVSLGRQVGSLWGKWHNLLSPYLRLCYQLQPPCCSCGWNCRGRALRGKVLPQQHFLHSSSALVLLGQPAVCLS